MDAKEYSLYDNNKRYQNNNNQDSDDLGLNAAPINIDIDTPKNIYPLEDQCPNPSDFPQYNKITNSNQPSDFFELNHKGITQINENTFYIKRKCSCHRFSQCLPLFFAFIFIIVIVAITTTKGPFYLIFLISGITFIFTILIFIFFICKIHKNSVKFELNENNIKVTLTSCCCNKKEIIYMKGEITEIKFNLRIDWAYKSDESTYYYYEIKIIQNIPGKEPEFSVFNEADTTRLFTNEEIDYFKRITNHHIQNYLNK